MAWADLAPSGGDSVDFHGSWDGGHALEGPRNGVSLTLRRQGCHFACLPFASPVTPFSHISPKCRALPDQSPVQQARVARLWPVAECAEGLGRAPPFGRSTLLVRGAAQAARGQGRGPAGARAWAAGE